MPEVASDLTELGRAVEQLVLARLGAVREQAIEDAAACAWSSLMDICYQSAIHPSEMSGKWFAVCEAIRALKDKPVEAAPCSYPKCPCPQGHDCGKPQVALPVNYDELKPCPFCGSEDVSISVGKDPDGRDWKYVECEECSSTAELNVWNIRDVEVQP